MKQNIVTKLTSTLKNKTGLLYAILILAICIPTYLYKLDYPYFFTDEILYVNAGREYILEQDYTLNLQHPFVAKYIAGLASLISPHNVGILRLPFALFGALSCLAVYLIIADEFKNKSWGLVGSLLYLCSPFIFTSTRMAMMESPMHFFWLLFNLFFLKYLKSVKIKDAIFSGIFMGLAFATKSTSALLLMSSVLSLLLYTSVYKKKINEYKSYLIITGVSAVTFLSSYIDLAFRRGVSGFIDIFRSIKDVLFDRNSEGKIHVVNGEVYTKSPWWFYPFYISKNYNVLNIFTILSGAISPLINKSFFTFHWFIFFFLNVIFFSLMSLKNSRYISSIEVSLVFLILIFIKYVYEKFSKKLVYLILIGLLLSRFLYLYNLKPNSFNALYQYLRDKTNNFTNGERVYVFGSIRSSRWYFEGIKTTIVVIRKDFDIMAPEFPNFKYIGVEDSEDIKDPNNAMSVFLKQNADNYSVKDLDGVKLYTRNY